MLIALPDILKVPSKLPNTWVIGVSVTPQPTEYKTIVRELPEDDVYPLRCQLLPVDGQVDAPASLGVSA